MKIRITEQLDTKSEVLALGIFEDKNEYEEIPEIHEKIQNAIKKDSFKLKKEEKIVLNIPNSTYDKTIIISLGKKEEIDMETIRTAMSLIVKEAKQDKNTSITTNVPLLVKQNTKLTDNEIGIAAAEGLILTNYKYTKKKENQTLLSDVSIQWEKNTRMLNAGIRMGTVIANATNYARNLVNEPSNIKNPDFMEKQARELAKKHKLKITVLKRKDLQQKKMNGILAVGNGSKYEPRLIILQHKQTKPRRLALVGKGVTFDTGGISLKPEGAIEDMKMDMAGAAAVMGTIKAAAELGIDMNITAVLPIVENSVSQESYRPGDVIEMYNKKTVEVINTDAEGRMILADAMTYAEKDLKSETIIDIATLTGACMVALGYEASGLFTEDQALAQSIERAGNKSQDKVWRLPLYESFKKDMEGDITDLKNLKAPLSAGRVAGAVTAAAFLSNFTTTRWAHIDIAGPAYLPKEDKYKPKYATGAGTRLLTYYLLEQ